MPVKNNKILHGETLSDFFKSLGSAFGILVVIAVVYFYIYLPQATNHNEEIPVPDFLGLASERLDSAMEASGLRYEINDSSYSDNFGPLEISRQFPAPGSMVKPGRKIFISINRTEPPTVPIPSVEDLSLINAQSILISNGLRPGKVIYEPGPFAELVISVALGGRKIPAGARVAKGTYIDLVVGDGAGPKDFVISNLVGISLKNAMLLISNWNLHLGDVEVGPDSDTTGVESFVYRQMPQPGDSVRIGQPVHLWIAPKGYEPPSDSTEIDF